MFNRVAQQEARTRLLKILIGGSILPIGLFIYNAEDIFQTMQFGQKFKQRRERLDKENEINRERLIDNYDRLDKLYGITEKEHRKQMKEYGYDSKSSLFQEENKDNQEKNEEDVIKEKNLLNDEDMKVKLVEGKNYSQLQVSNKDETPDPRVAGAKFYFDTRLNTEELNKVENRAQREDIMKILENITEQDGFIEKVETSKKKFRFGDDSAECGGMYDDTWSGMEDIIYHSAQRDKYQKNNMNFDERRYYNDRDYFDNNDSFNNREAYKNRNSYDDENSYNNENSYVNEDSYQERKAYENDNMYENRNNYQSNDFEEDRGSYRDKVYEEHQYYEDNYDSGRKHSIDMLWKEHMEYVRHLEEIGYGAKRESREPEEPEETEPNDNRNALKEKETILNPNIQETVDESTINTENNINTKDENDTKEEPTLAQESTPNIEEPTSNFTYISQKEYKPLIPINKLSRAIDFSNCSNIWQIKQLVHKLM